MSSSPRIIPNAEVLYVADANRYSSKSTTTLTGIVGEKIRTPRDDHTISIKQPTNAFPTVALASNTPQSQQHTSY